MIIDIDTPGVHMIKIYEPGTKETMAFIIYANTENKRIKSYVADYKGSLEVDEHGDLEIRIRNQNFDLWLPNSFICLNPQIEDEITKANYTADVMDEGYLIEVR